MNSFASGLVSSKPAPEHQHALMLYGQFVGDWVADTSEYQEGGTVAKSSWDIRFSWVLEGRAIQDLWISPIRKDTITSWDTPDNRFSTTIRMYDPKIDAWHILWFNPPSGAIVRQIGRRVGEDIVQVGSTDLRGNPVRWCYRDITPNSFHWFGERSFDQGTSWTVVQEMRAVRAG